VRRERLLIASVVPRALLLGTAAAAMTGGGQAVLVIVLVAVAGGLASVFRQVQAALLPWLARTPDELTGANTAASVVQSAAMIGGPVVAAGLLAVGTAQVAMLAACGLVAVGAVLLTGVRRQSSGVPAPVDRPTKQLTRDIAAGWQAGVGWLGALPGLGGLIAGPLAVMLVRDKRVARCFAGGVAGWGVPMIVLAFGHAPYWPLLMFGLIGVANVFDDARVYSALQQVIPPRLTGRAMGMRRAVLLLSMGLGSAVAPVLIRAWGARGTLLATGLLLVVVAASYGPSLAAIDRTIAAPGPDYALLRRVSFFGSLPFAIVEHLASELQSAIYEPGDVIFAEGEPGERFYLIADGRVRLCRDGEQLSEMGPGCSFGEIALLRRIPRTATVTAITHLQVKILAREEFLAAVTGNPDSVRSADELVSTRLGDGHPRQASVGTS
jgi:hypothetical protein